MIILITDYFSCLISKMSETDENCQFVYSQIQYGVLKCLPLSTTIYYTTILGLLSSQRKET